MGNKYTKRITNKILRYKEEGADADIAKIAFKQRRYNGLNLSQRVWNFTEQFKEEMEVGLK